MAVSAKLWLTAYIVASLAGQQADAHSVKAMIMTPQSPSQHLARTEYLELSQSTAMMNQERYSEAIVLLKRAIEKNPINVFSYFNLGYSHMALAEKEGLSNALKQAHLAAAEQAFARVMTLNPELAVTYFKLGRVALLQENGDKAIAYYQQGLEQFPQHAAFAFNMARVYDQQTKYDQAIDYYNQAITLDPAFIYAYNNLGLLYESQKKYTEAEALYKKALIHDPKYNYARLNLGNLYVDTERYTEAKALYEESLTVDPSNPWASLYLGNLYFMEGNFAQSTKYYEHSVQQNPSFATAYYLLAVSLSKMDKLDEAISASINYVSLEPEGKYTDEVKRLLVQLKLKKQGMAFMVKDPHPGTQP